MTNPANPTALEAKAEEEENENEKDDDDDDSAQPGKLRIHSHLL